MGGGEGEIQIGSDVIKAASLPLSRWIIVLEEMVGHRGLLNIGAVVKISVNVEISC